MGTALNASYFKDPVRGYAKYIDVDAAIDHHLLNVVAFNVDALTPRRQADLWADLGF